MILSMDDQAIWTNTMTIAPSSATMVALFSETALRFFTPGQVEVVRFESDGRAYVRGELVDSNAEVYVALREWLVGAGIMK